MNGKNRILKICIVSKVVEKYVRIYIYIYIRSNDKRTRYLLHYYIFMKIS